jgi:phage shock protein A
MSFFKRLMTVIKSNLNALLGSAENPQKVLEQSLEDMQTQFMRAQTDVARSIVDEKKLLGELEKDKQQAEEWERRAMLAVKEGRDDLAAQALDRQAEHSQSAQRLHAAWTQHRTATEALKKSLRSMNEQIAELKRKKNLLVARQTRAEAKERIHTTMSTLNSGGAMDAFARMEEKIDDMEARAAAAAELASDLTGDSLEQQFAALEYRGSSNQRLLELKQKMATVANDVPKFLTAEAEVVEVKAPAARASAGGNRSKS